MRLSAVEDAHQEIAVGLIPLILAFGLPVYPLVQIVWLDWLEDLQLVWIGLALTGTLVALLCLYAIGRQLYPARDHYTMIGVPIDDLAWLDAIPTGAPVLVIGEGFFMYLAEVEVLALFRRIAAQR